MDSAPHAAPGQRPELKGQRGDEPGEAHAAEGQIEDVRVLVAAASELAVVGVQQGESDDMIGEEADVVLSLAVDVEPRAAPHGDRRVARQDWEHTRRERPRTATGRRP